jgi:hypothetical protein
VDGAVAIAARIDGPRERDPRRRLQQARVMAAHHPEADDGAPQHRRWLDGGHAGNTRWLIPRNCQAM